MINTSFVINCKLTLLKVKRKLESNINQSHETRLYRGKIYMICVQTNVILHVDLQDENNFGQERSSDFELGWTKLSLDNISKYVYNYE